MMQHVATAKSEVAAFATDVGSNSRAGSESNEQFGKVLQDQKSLNASLVVKPDNAPPQTSNKKASQQSSDEFKSEVASPVNKDQTAQNKNTVNEHIKATNTQSSSSSQDMVDAEDDNVSDVESVDNNLNSKLNVSNTKAELQLVLPTKQDDIEADVKPSGIDAEEWVLLVDNLKKMAGIVEFNKQPVSLDVPAADLRLPNNVEEGLLDHIVDQKIVDKLKVTSDGINILQAENNKVAVDLAQDEPVLVAKEKVTQNISTLVNEALGKALTSQDNGDLKGIGVRQKTAELLLEQPEVLQSLIAKQTLASQNSGTDTTVDNVVKKDFPLVNQLTEIGEQVDLTLAENKALLRNLLVDTETGKNLTQEPVKVAKPVTSDALEKTMQAGQTETLVAKLETVAEQVNLPEKEAQLSQAALGNVLNANKTEKLLNNNDLKPFLNLTDSKLDKVLENIAQRVFDSKKTGEPISPEQIAQKVVIPRVSEIISSVESSSKDFISALRSGLEEFKNQLSQGREPGIDLKALVSDALAKTTDTGAVVKASVNIELMVKNISQVLDFAQTMNRAIEHNHDQVYSAVLRDVAQIQGEQSKQIQLNQFESKFEKAINIAKPEGHQQLAEKVRWMVNTRNLVADIRLDPAELGSVHVKVSMSGESATVNFVVQSQQARDAVDNATPRLREMLAEKGIELGQSSVHQDSNGQQGQGDGDLAKQGARGKDESEDIDVPEQVLAQQNIVNGALGGIDYFV